MADIVDIASDFVASELAFQVERIRSNMRHRMGPENCILCDSDIPLARRRHGFDMCIHCAEEEERRDALFAKN